jgi:hypothetical protein
MLIGRSNLCDFTIFYPQLAVTFLSYLCTTESGRNFMEDLFVPDLDINLTLTLKVILVTFATTGHNFVIYLWI